MISILPPVAKCAIVASISAILLFLSQACARGADSPEIRHQKLLAGEPISFSPSEPENARAIDATWVKEAALRHVKIEISQAVIQGRLDAQNVAFDQNVRFERCIFNGYTDFSRARFKGSVDFGSAIFRSGTSFHAATFEELASFNDSQFESAGTDFSDAHFSREFSAILSSFGSSKSGTVSFIHVRFDSRTDFTRARFGTNGADFIGAQFGADTIFAGATFQGPVEFERSQFMGLALLGGARFSGPAFFDETEFTSSAWFTEAVFKSKCSFYRARFKANALFTSAQFQSDVTFESTQVLGDLIFETAEERLPAATFRGEARFAMLEIEHSGRFTSVVFAGRVIFDGAKFAGASTFQDVQFKNRASFLDARFGNDVGFPGATFAGDAVFDRVQITGAALFSRKPGDVPPDSIHSARFAHKASFAAARFDSEARFIEVKFEQQADFAAARFEGDAHFEGASFAGGTSFQSTIFRAVYFSPEAAPPQFMSEVNLLGCTYDRMQINWRSLLRYPNGASRIHPYDRQPYIQLEGMLRKSGLDKDADAVYAERRRVERQSLSGAARLWDTVYWFTANYGLDLWHELFLTTFFLLSGMFVFSRPLAVLEGTHESDCETTISLTKALRLAVHQFLPFGLPVKPRWTPSERALITWPIRLFRPSSYANFLQIIGWILIPLAVAALAAILRRGA